MSSPTPDPLPQFSASILDEIDYGLVVLDASGTVSFLNAAAHSELGASGVLCIDEYRLKTTHANEAPALDCHLALALKGRRELVVIKGPLGSQVVALIPLFSTGESVVEGVLVIIGRSRLCTDLSLRLFAQRCGLTATESAVLELLCRGLGPQGIAHAQGVGTNTIRTQIISIRRKMNMRSIRAVADYVGRLPSVMPIRRRFW